MAGPISMSEETVPGLRPASAPNVVNNKRIVACVERVPPWLQADARISAHCFQTFHRAEYFTRWLFKNPFCREEQQVTLLTTWREGKPAVNSIVAVITGNEESIRTDDKRVKLAEPTGLHNAPEGYRATVSRTIIMLDMPSQLEKAMAWVGTLAVPLEIAFARNVDEMVEHLGGFNWCGPQRGIERVASTGVGNAQLESVNQQGSMQDIIAARRPLTQTLMQNALRRPVQVANGLTSRYAHSAPMVQLEGLTQQGGMASNAALACGHGARSMQLPNLGQQDGAPKNISPTRQAVPPMMQLGGLNQQAGAPSATAPAGGQNAPPMMQLGGFNQQVGAPSAAAPAGQHAPPMMQLGDLNQQGYIAPMHQQVPPVMQGGVQGGFPLAPRRGPPMMQLEESTQRGVLPCNAPAGRFGPQASQPYNGTARTPARNPVMLQNGADAAGGDFGIASGKQLVPEAPQQFDTGKGMIRMGNNYTVEDHAADVLQRLLSGEGQPVHNPTEPQNENALAGNGARQPQSSNQKAAQEMYGPTPCGNGASLPCSSIERAVQEMFRAPLRGNGSSTAQSFAEPAVQGTTALMHGDYPVQARRFEEEAPQDTAMQGPKFECAVQSAPALKPSPGLENALPRAGAGGTFVGGAGSDGADARLLAGEAAVGGAASSHEAPLAVAFDPNTVLPRSLPTGPIQPPSIDDVPTTSLWAPAAQPVAWPEALPLGSRVLV